MKKLFTLLSLLFLGLFAFGCSSEPLDAPQAPAEEQQIEAPIQQAVPTTPAQSTEAIGAGVDDVAEVQEELNTDELSDIDAALGDIENI